MDIGIIGIALFPFTKVIGIRVVVIRTNRSVVVVVVRRSSVVVVVCRIRSRSRSCSRIIRSIRSNRSIRSSICISSCSIPSIRVGIGVGNAIVPEHGTFGPDGNVLDPPHHVGIFFGPNLRVLTETQRRRPVRVIVVVRLVSVGGSIAGPVVKGPVKSSQDGFEASRVGFQVIRQGHEALNRSPFGSFRVFGIAERVGTAI